MSDTLSGIFGSYAVTRGGNYADKYFEEWPVTLDEFVTSSRYLANPPLSAIQYDAVRHAERIYYPDMYDYLARNACHGNREETAALRAYWAKPVRMVNFLELEWGKGCPVKGSEIYSAESGRWIKVEDWRGGWVAAAEEDGSIQAHKSTPSWCSGRGRSLEFRFSSGLKHQVYEGHQYLTPDGWRHARDLKVGDRVGLATRLPEPLETAELPNHEVELVGWWLGDGIMPRDSSRGSVLMLFADHEVAAKAAYCEAVKRAGAVPDEEGFQREGKQCWYVGSRVPRRPRPTTRAEREQRRGQKLGRPRNPLNVLVDRYGLAGKTAHTKRVPQEFFKLPGHQVILFLSRLWGTDGWVHVRQGAVPEVGYSTVCEGLAWDIQRLLLRIGCLAQVQQRNGSWTVRMRDRTNAVRFCSLVRLLDKGAAQDQAVAQAARSVRRRHGDVQWAYVREIIDIGEQEYYDLEVPGPANYVGDGGVVNHNSGKDHVSRIAVLRACYLLLCLRSPQAYYEMPIQDSIHVINVAVNSKQATRAFFNPLRKAVMREGNWFQTMGVEVSERVVRRGRPAKKKPEDGGASTALLDTIRFPKNVEAVSGHSDADSQEGLNLIMGVADEIDAFKTVGELEKSGGRKGARESSSTAEAILQMLQTSASTRFETYKNIRISWPRYKGSKIMQLIEEGNRDLATYGEESRHYVSGPYATWEVNPRVRGKEQFAADYRDDPVMSRARYECKPSFTVAPYFANEMAVRSCAYRTTSGQQPLEVDYVRDGQAWSPRYMFADSLYPIQGARYAMHADLAVDSCRAGVSLAHVKTWKDVTVLGSDEGGLDVTTLESRPVVKVDFVIGFEADKSAQPAREIQIRWVGDLVLELRRRGFIIAQFTADQWQCLSGDTRIPLLDGTAATMRELAERTEPFWVYSIRDGRVVPGKCTRAWRTAYRTDMLEVELDNGEKIRATSDHRFMLRDGTYRRARELRPGDSLMPLYRRLRRTSESSEFYEQVWHPEKAQGENRWMFTHSMVSRYWHGPTPRGWVTHHKNCNERDNSPGNLQRLTNAEHTRLHMELGRVCPFGELWKDPEWRQAHVAQLAELRRADKGKPSRRGRNTARADVTFERIKAVTEAIAAERRDFSWREVARELGIGSQWLLYSRIKEAGYPSWKAFRESVQPPSYGALATRRYRERQANNHQVVAVRLAAPEDVYDLEVEEHHNFATEAGVFVHNSLDLQQRLTMAGIETDKFSLDRDEVGWRTLRDLAYEARLEFPDWELLVTEILSLSRLPNGKIDHPSDGSKDLADAMAGAVHGAVLLGGQEDEQGRRAWPGIAHQWGGQAVKGDMPIGMPDLGYLAQPDEFIPEEVKDREMDHLLLPGGGFIYDVGESYSGYQ